MKSKLLKQIRKEYYFELKYIPVHGKPVHAMVLMTKNSEYALDVEPVIDNNITEAKFELVKYLIKRLRIKHPNLGYYNKTNQPIKLTFDLQPCQKQTNLSKPANKLN